MLWKILKICPSIMIILLSVCVQVSAQDSLGAEKEKTAALQKRIDFGNSYIMGQSIKSGSVYLLNRKRNKISSMLKVRRDFRKEIMEDFSLENTKIISEEPAGEKKGPKSKPETNHRLDKK